MGWSWRIGRIAGIDVYVHPTFLLLLAWVALSNYFAHGDLAEATLRPGLYPGLVRDRGPARIGARADRPALRHPHPRHHAPAHRRGGPAGADS